MPAYGGRGSQHQSSGYTLTECRKACEFDPRCVAVEWLPTDGDCWINTITNHAHQIHGSQTWRDYGAHHDLVSRCNLTAGQNFTTYSLFDNIFMSLLRHMTRKLPNTFNRPLRFIMIVRPCVVWTETSCENGIVHNSTCYKIHREPVNWFTAVNRCLSNNGSLAVFDDHILKYFASTLLREGALWIGLIKSWWTWPDAGLSWY